jgi:hypothetical protein
MYLVDILRGIYLAALRAFAGLRCFLGDVYFIAGFLEDFYDFFSKIVANVKVFLESL